MKPLLLSLTLWLAFALPTRAFDPASLEQSLDGPQVLVLRSGQIYEGRAQGVREGQLIFVRPSAGGQAEYTFSAEEVERLDFPGGENKLLATQLIEAGHPGEALPILDALYHQRAAYLDFLPEGERAFFIKLVEAARTAGDPYQAVGVAKTLLAHSEEPANRRRLNDLILLGYYRLPLQADTRALAQAWIAENPRYGDSALGWYILARLDYDAGDYAGALATALEPVTFSSQYPMEYLPHCYAVAILAALGANDTDEMLALAREMNARHLAWPEDEGLGAYADFYQNLLAAPPTNPPPPRKRV